jgi:release factor glutamine methyltransferase
MLAREETMRFAELGRGDAVRRLARELAEAGVDAPQRDARLLVAAAVGGTSLELLAEPAQRLTAIEAATLAAYARRRARREPVSRILAEREFFGRSFEIGPATLDPRPSSETLIDAALEIGCEEGWGTRPVRVLDVGTGSGCLLLSLIAELPFASGLGTDASAEALLVAEANARRLGLSALASFARHNYLEGIEGPFDLLISNPPYVASGDIATLEPEVSAHDPRLALDGGADGLDAYRVLAAGLERVVPRGWVLLEVGAGQAAAVTAILSASVCAGRTPLLRCWKDLAGHERCVAMKTQL